MDEEVEEREVVGLYNTHNVVLQMTLQEALSECQHWLDYLDRQKAKSIALQHLATEVRLGNLTPNQAKTRRYAIDRDLKVYDGSKLAEAVKVLMRIADGKEQSR